MLSVLATISSARYYKARLESQQLRDQILADLTQDLGEAKKMQATLLPESAPNISYLQIAGRNLGAKEVGGDFFDYLEGDGNQLSIAVGDISGKGLRGTMNAVMSSGILRLASSENPEASVDLLISKTNKALCDSMEQDSIHGTMVLAQFHISQPW